MIISVAVDQTNILSYHIIFFFFSLGYFFFSRRSPLKNIHLLSSVYEAVKSEYFHCDLQTGILGRTPILMTYESSRSLWITTPSKKSKEFLEMTHSCHFVYCASCHFHIFLTAWRAFLKMFRLSRAPVTYWVWYIYIALSSTWGAFTHSALSYLNRESRFCHEKCICKMCMV